MFTLKEIIAIAVQIERNGEDIYRSALERNPSAEMGELLRSLADEEDRHAAWFEALGRETENPTVDGALDKMARLLLQATVEGTPFSLEESDLSQARDRDKVLEMAVEFEKDTLVFYEMLRAFIQEESSLEALDRIIEEEKRHVARLTALLEESALLSK